MISIDPTGDGPIGSIIKPGVVINSKPTQI